MPFAYQGLVSGETVERCCRQMMCNKMGAEGQQRLSASKILIVGCGGLGCPAAIYLAGAGIGTIGLVDGDTIERSNLHRQILHTDDGIGSSKARSIETSIRAFNPTVKVETLTSHLSTENARDLFSQYHVVLDCTDNPASRYLINDAAMLQGIPVVSASALRWEGQLTVYGYQGGPCYRCLFPDPPPSGSIGSCSDNGVVGTVPGTMGCMQATECIKVCLGLSSQEVLSGRMLFIDALSAKTRVCKLRGRQEDCIACSANVRARGTFSKELLSAQGETCAVSKADLPSKNRTSIQDFAVMVKDQSCLVVDVRHQGLSQALSLQNSTCIPLSSLRNQPEVLLSLISQAVDQKKTLAFLCRRGNDSSLAAKLALDARDASLSESANLLHVVSVDGGLHAWSKEIDDSFPIV